MRSLVLNGWTALGNLRERGRLNSLELEIQWIHQNSIYFAPKVHLFPDPFVSANLMLHMEPPVAISVQYWIGVSKGLLGLTRDLTGGS